MRQFIWMIAIWPVLAWADSDGASVLTGARIEAALTERALRYTDNATQTFGASGATMYEAGRPTWGRWAVRGDQYCSQWPPSDFWTCYDMEKDGPVIRFIGADGGVTEGIYSDE